MALSTQGAETAEVTEAAETSTTALPVVLAQAVVYLLLQVAWAVVVHLHDSAVPPALLYTAQEQSRCRSR